MTVLTKTSEMQKKPELLGKPIFVGRIRYTGQAAAPRSRAPRQYIIDGTKYNRLLLCFAFVSTLLALMGGILGLIYYNEYNANKPMRFRGYCTIPMEVAKAASQVKKGQQAEASYRVPLRWTSDPDVTVLSNMDNQSTGEVLNSLLERFDIDDNVERISVVNGGQNVEFIHDFNANATGIVDSKRCFVMDLDPEAVLSPSVFMVNIESNSDFDLQRMTRRLRALLPAAAVQLQHLSAVLAERCIDRPTYHLEKEEGNIIRKRSVDEPKQDYLHFAGKHLLEISIDNMGELLEYEKNHA